MKLAVHKLTGQNVAIKIVDKVHAPALVREIETWRQLRHPNVVQLYEVLCTESKIYMVTEYCNGGEAFEYITKNGRLDDRQFECKNIFRQIVEAVGHCHEKGLVHRDLKLENIVLTDNNTVKLIDFGFTTNYQNQHLLETYCGSSAYASPEIIIGKKYSGPETDIWSLGVILYTLVCGELPFDDDNDAVIHRKITDVEYTLPDYLSEGDLILTLECENLIESLLQSDPSERLPIAAILNHEWLSQLAPESCLEVKETSIELPLGATKEEIILAAKLNSIGIDVASMLEAVQSNTCDQSSAMWYLLLEKARDDHKSSESISATPLPANSTHSSCPTLLKLSESERFSLESSMDSITISLDVEKHFSNVIKRGVATSENPILRLSRKSAADALQSNVPVSSVLSNDLLSNRPKASSSNRLTPVSKSSNKGTIPQIIPMTQTFARRNIMMEAMRPKINQEDTDELSPRMQNNVLRPKSAGNASGRVSIRKSNQIIEEFEDT